MKKRIKKNGKKEEKGKGKGKRKEKKMGKEKEGMTGGDGMEKVLGSTGKNMKKI